MIHSYDKPAGQVLVFSDGQARTSCRLQIVAVHAELSERAAGHAIG